MFFDQSVTDAQPKPSSLAYTLRGVERFENTMRLFESRTRILEHNGDGIVPRSDRDLEPALRI